MTDENVNEETQPTARQRGEAYAAKKFGDRHKVEIKDDYTRQYLQRRGWL
ncbi:hypothetical protein ACFVAV_23365 [Nocardia sp. NPDC057663]